MALAAINVKKPREAQIWNCCTGNPVLRILPDSNVFLLWLRSFAKASFKLVSDSYSCIYKP